MPDVPQRDTRTLLSHECYRDKQALDAHLASSAWTALTKGGDERSSG